MLPRFTAAFAIRLGFLCCLCIVFCRLVFFASLPLFLLSVRSLVLLFLVLNVLLIAFCLLVPMFMPLIIFLADLWLLNFILCCCYSSLLAVVSPCCPPFTCVFLSVSCFLLASVLKSFVDFLFIHSFDVKTAFLAAYKAPCQPLGQTQPAMAGFRFPPSQVCTQIDRVLVLNPGRLFVGWKNQFPADMAVGVSLPPWSESPLTAWEGKVQEKENCTVVHRVYPTTSLEVWKVMLWRLNLHAICVHKLTSICPINQSRFRVLYVYVWRSFCVCSNVMEGSWSI